MDLLLVILNYFVRGITIAVGLILIVNPFPALADNADFVRIFGGITVVFGILRTMAYHKNRKKMLREQQEENDENIED